MTGVQTCALPISVNETDDAVIRWAPQLRFGIPAKPGLPAGKMRLISSIANGTAAKERGFSRVDSEICTLFQTLMLLPTEHKKTF